MITAAIITAAGQGMRMGMPVAKQFLPILGKPLIWHTIRVFEKTPAIDDIILVLPPETLDLSREYFGNEPDFKKIRQVISGGTFRQDSVRNGLNAVAERAQIVLVHDGVRPLVDEELIVRIIECAKENGAAIAAIPATNTLKRVSGKGRILETVPRDHLWCAQTPQAFRIELLRRAFAAIEGTPFQGTDEASLVERLGDPVHVVPGARTNIKVTTPFDLRLIEILLKERYDSANP